MEKTLNYRFQLINIKVVTNSPIIQHFLDNYMRFESIDEIPTPDITVSFYEKYNTDKYIKNITEKAEILCSSENDLNGKRIYKRLKNGEYERWHIAEGLGCSYINIKDGSIYAVYENTIDKTDILPYILFLNNPLLSLIRHKGYPYLHAACVNVCGKSVLFTGLSGRGKSTATFSLIKRGHCALTDEATLIREENGCYNAYATMGWIKVSKDAKTRFFEDIEATAIRCIHEYIYLLKDVNCSNTDIISGSKIEYIIILEQTGLPETKIKPAGTLEVIKEMFPVALSYEDREYLENTFDVFAKLMESVKLRKVYFGTDMDSFADTVEKEVSNNND